MLHRIAVENFFSIADRQEINLKVPGNAPDLSCFRPSCAAAEDRLPTVVGFFGPNASGKSTVLRAIIATAAFARESFACPLEGLFLCFNPSCVEIGGESQPLSSSTLTDNSQQINRQQSSVTSYASHTNRILPLAILSPKPWPLSPCPTRPRENSAASTSARDRNLVLARNSRFRKTILES